MLTSSAPTPVLQLVATTFRCDQRAQQSVVTVRAVADDATGHAVDGDDHADLKERAAVGVVFMRDFDVHVTQPDARVDRASCHVLEDPANYARTQAYTEAMSRMKEAQARKALELGLIPQHELTRIEREASARRAIFIAMNN